MFPPEPVRVQSGDHTAGPRLRGVGLLLIDVVMAEPAPYLVPLAARNSSTSSVAWEISR
jgi:hypothetical protein